MSIEEAAVSNIREIASIVELLERKGLVRGGSYLIRREQSQNRSSHIRPFHDRIAYEEPLLPIFSIAYSIAWHKSSTADSSVIYAQILKELEDKNPAGDRGHRKSRHHQWLTDDVGNPALAQHLHTVITLMKLSNNWEKFYEMLNQAFPKRGDTLQLPLMVDPFS